MEKEYFTPHIQLLLSSRLTDSGFIRVVVSPMGWFLTKDFKILRMIFPLRVFGSSLVNIILSGLAVGPM